MKHPKIILLALITILAIISCQKKQVTSADKTKFEQIVEKAKAPTYAERKQIETALNNK